MKERGKPTVSGRAEWLISWAKTSPSYSPTGRGGHFGKKVTATSARLLCRYALGSDSHWQSVAA